MHFLYFIYVRSGRPNYEKWPSQWSSSDAWVSLLVGVSLLVAGMLVVSRNYIGSACCLYLCILFEKSFHISDPYVSISFVQAQVSNPKAVILHIELHIFWIELFILFS